MKKLLAFILASSLMFTLIGCGTTESKTDDVSSVQSVKEVNSDNVVDPEIRDTFCEISWPTFGKATLLPAPSWCASGTICVDSQWGFTAYIDNTSKKQFNDYVKQLYDAGYTIDYSKNDIYFSGTSEDKNLVVVRYFDDNAMYIDIWDISDDYFEDLD